MAKFSAMVNKEPESNRNSWMEVSPLRMSLVRLITSTDKMGCF